jgi:diguanylate cyclase (GGDEF)-like protein
VTRARILAVDDQLYFRVFLEDTLGREGYEVVTAGDGEEALERLAEQPFDLVLTDLVMPRMDGHALVQRIRERWPDRDVVVVSGVGDVATAVDAMKHGATDYLLKPIEREPLVRTVAAILERRRMREEHARLMAENLEYMGAFTLYERALGLFSQLSPESLADRIVEVLCLETSAHGGVLWLTGVERPSRLRLAGVRGLVRVENEPEEVDLAALPPGLERLREPECRSFLWPPPDGSEVHPALYVPLRHGARLFGLVRLTDRLDGRVFDEADREVGDRFAPYGAQALANALRFRALERRSFRDLATGAYNQAYFEDVTQNEIRKASRFGRQFSLVRVVLDGLPMLRSARPGDERAAWLQRVAHHVARACRGTDLLAVEGDGRFCLLLPETDRLGAAVVKRRIRGALERCAEMRELDAADRPTPLLGTVGFPADGSDAQQLHAALDARVEEDRSSLLRVLDLEAKPFRGLVDALLGEAQAGRRETIGQVGRFLLDEVARSPHERGVLFLAPGTDPEAGLEALRPGLEALRGSEPRTSVVVLGERGPEAPAGTPVVYVPPERVGTGTPFLVYFGEGPSYALVGDAEEEAGGCAVFQTADPVLIEHMVFQLGRDLGVALGG